MEKEATHTAVFSMKSWLFTPGTEESRFARAAQAGADALIIDLEDAVPTERKPEARQAAIAYLAQGQSQSIASALRINAVNTWEGIEDIRALLVSDARPDFLVLPKCSSAATVALVHELLSEAGKPTQIIALIESAKGLAAIEDMASQTPRPAAFLFGAADMAADIGGKPEWEPLLFARSRVVQAAAVGAIAALDSPYFDLSDQEGLRRESSGAASLGFHGKCAIHPKQLATINEIFSPSEQEIAWARRVIDATQQGAAVVDGKMVDQAMARRAKLVLARSPCST